MDPVLIKTPEDLVSKLAGQEDPRLFLPGVGNFGHFVHELNVRGFAQPIRDYIDSGRRLMGICVGLQTVFADSEEANNEDTNGNKAQGLGIIDRSLFRFSDKDKSVPQIGWNTIKYANAEDKKHRPVWFGSSSRYHFVNSFAAILTRKRPSWHSLAALTMLLGLRTMT